MKYGEIRSQFKSILNRRDCSDTLADTFLNQALLRCTRELRTPSQETYGSMIVGSTFDGFPVPNDLVSIIAVIANNQKVDFKSIARFFELDLDSAGQPQFYTRIGNKFQFSPSPTEGTELIVSYYGEFTPFSGDSSETNLSLVAPDILIYAALSYASDYFMDERGQAFEERYGQIRQALQDQAYDLEGSDAALSPTYNADY